MGFGGGFGDRCPGQDVSGLCTTIDPLHTDDACHMRYHEANRQRGLPAGLSVIRLRYRAHVDGWVPLWMPTGAEFADAAFRGGWMVTADVPDGVYRIRQFAISKPR